MTLLLREARAHVGMSQLELARLSRIGVKTLSSFECGSRIDSMKWSQLERIVDALGMSIEEFLAGRYVRHSELLPDAQRRRPEVKWL